LFSAPDPHSAVCLRARAIRHAEGQIWENRLSGYVQARL